MDQFTNAWKFCISYVGVQLVCNIYEKLLIFLWQTLKKQDFMMWNFTSLCKISNVLSNIWWWNMKTLQAVFWYILKTKGEKRYLFVLVYHCFTVSFIETLKNQLSFINYAKFWVKTSTRKKISIKRALTRSIAIILNLIRGH